MKYFNIRCPTSPTFLQAQAYQKRSISHRRVSGHVLVCFCATRGFKFNPMPAFKACRSQSNPLFKLDPQWDAWLLTFKGTELDSVLFTAILANGATWIIRTWYNSRQPCSHLFIPKTLFPLPRREPSSCVDTVGWYCTDVESKPSPHPHRHETFAFARPRSAEVASCPTLFCFVHLNDIIGKPPAVAAYCTGRGYWSVKQKHVPCGLRAILSDTFVRKIIIEFS